MEEVVQKPEHLPGFEPVNPRIEGRAATLKIHTVWEAVALLEAGLDGVLSSATLRMRLPCLAFSSTSSLHGLARSRDYTLSSFSRRSTFHNSAPVSLFVGGPTKSQRDSAQLQSLWSGREVL